LGSVHDTLLGVPAMSQRGTSNFITLYRSSKSILGVLVLVDIDCTSSSFDWSPTTTMSAPVIASITIPPLDSISSVRLLRLTLSLKFPAR
jgi:hypothetical protein